MKRVKSTVGHYTYFNMIVKDTVCTVSNMSIVRGRVWYCFVHKVVLATGICLIEKG